MGEPKKTTPTPTTPGVTTPEGTTPTTTEVTTPQVTTPTAERCIYKEFVYEPGQMIGIVMIQENCFLVYCDMQSQIRKKSTSCPTTTTPAETTPIIDTTTTPEGTTPHPHNTPD